MVDVAKLQADDDAYAEYVKKNPSPPEQQAQQPQQAPPSLLQQWTSNVGRVTMDTLDSAVSKAESLYDQVKEGAAKVGDAAKRGMEVAASSREMRVPRDVASGVVTGAVNTADAVYSADRFAKAQVDAVEKDPMRGVKVATGQEPMFVPSPPSSPIWDHAKATVLDFRDAIAVKDPVLADSLLQGAAQLAIPYMGYSRALSGIHGVSNMLAAGAITDATALAPHDPRMADLFALGRHTEGKLGSVLREAAPDGSALNGYINYLADRGNESEAEGRFKNVLDGAGVNLVAGGLFQAVASTLKQGQSGLRWLVDQGVTKASDIAPEAPLALPAPKDTPAESAAPPREDADFAQAPQGSAAASPLEKDTAITAARTFMKAQAEVGKEGSLHAMVTSLADHIDSSTPEGTFYKEILGRLSSKKLETVISTPGTGAQPPLEGPGSNKVGSYSHVENTIALHPAAFKDNATMLHAVTHEAVHAATVSALKEDPAIAQAVTELLGKAKMAALTPHYGLTNEKEFVAEAESNPKFQQFLKDKKSTDGKPLWDQYKKIIGTVLGVSGVALASPHFEKLLTQGNDGA